VNSALEGDLFVQCNLEHANGSAVAGIAVPQISPARPVSFPADEPHRAQCNDIGTDRRLVPTLGSPLASLAGAHRR